MQEIFQDIFLYGRGADRHGYQINPDIKKKIDAFLEKYPELILDDTLLSYTITQVFTGGWGGEFISATATSIVNYLLEHGAGVCCRISLPGFDLSMCRPQLLVGAQDEFLTSNQTALPGHVLRACDIFRLIRENKLTLVDIGRLHYQAEQGLKYVQLTEEVKEELVKVSRTLILCKLFSLRQLKAYTEYHVEILTICLQGMRQFAAVGFPRELTVTIVSNLTGMTFQEANDMCDKVVTVVKR